MVIRQRLLTVVPWHHGGRWRQYLDVTLRWLRLTTALYFIAFVLSGSGGSFYPRSQSVPRWNAKNYWPIPAALSGGREGGPSPVAGFAYDVDLGDRYGSD
jgi:hypothetical protein